MKSDLKESELLNGLAAGERDAVEGIYSRHYSMIQSMVINNNGTSDDARDVFQEAMIVLYQKSRNAEFELHCQLKTYLYSVCRRLWLKKLSQSQRLIPDLNGIDELVPVEDDIEAYEQRNTEYHLMEKALSGLGEPCKSLLEAFYLQKKNMSEIAANFGYTNPDNAKNQKYKCLMRLRKLFFTEYKINAFDE